MIQKIILFILILGFMASCSTPKNAPYIEPIIGAQDMEEQNSMKDKSYNTYLEVKIPPVTQSIP